MDGTHKNAYKPALQSGAALTARHSSPSGYEAASAPSSSEPSTSKTSATAKSSTTASASSSGPFVSLTVSFIPRGTSALLISRDFLPPAPHISGTVAPESSSASASTVHLLVLIVSVLLLIVSALALDRSVATAASATASETAISRIWASFNWSSFGPRDV